MGSFCKEFFEKCKQFQSKLILPNLSDQLVQTQIYQTKWIPNYQHMKKNEPVKVWQKTLKCIER